MKKLLLSILALLMAMSLTFTLAACDTGFLDDIIQGQKPSQAPEKPEGDGTEGGGETHVHTPSAAVKENEKAESCTEDGSYDEVVYCSDADCKAEISRVTKTIKSKGHNYVDGKCEICKEPAPDYVLKYSEGLEFVSNYDGTCYLASMGTCYDSEVVIPKKSPAGDEVIGIGPSGLRSSRVRTVVIHEGITYIDAIFDEVTYLLRINVSEENPVFKSIDGVLYSKNGEVLIKYPKARPESSFTIPDGVKQIGGSAFLNCENITTVIMPEGLISIEGFAFRHCKNLESVVFPSTLTYIGATAAENAFFGCNKLITEENGVEYVNNWAVSVKYDAGGCVEIKEGTVGIANQAAIFSVASSFVIPQSLKYVCENAFMYASNLSDVYYKGSAAEWNEIIVALGNDPFINATIHYNYVPEE